jgi:hypothetical protein
MNFVKLKNHFSTFFNMLLGKFKKKFANPFQKNYNLLISNFKHGTSQSIQSGVIT